MKTKTQQKLAAGLGVVTAGLVASSFAFASWSKTEGGANNAKGQANAMQFTLGTTGVTAVADAVPTATGATGTVVFTLTNNKPFSISLDNLIADGTTTAAGGNGVSNNACTDFSVPALNQALTTTQVSSGSLTVPGTNGAVGANVVTVTVPNVLRLANGTGAGGGATNDCQGAVATLSNLQVSAHSF